LSAAATVAALAACRGVGPGDLVVAIDTKQAGPTPQWVTAPAGTACTSPASDAGHVVFRVGRRVYRMEARVGAQPVDVSAALDRLSPGKDDYVNTSPNGEWLVVRTSRFGCGQSECLAIVSKNLCAAQVVFSEGVPISVDGAGVAVADDGSFLVLPGSDGPHGRDLYVVRREKEQFGRPALLTAASGARFNQQPALSPDGSRVLFDCGPEPGPEAGTEICEVGIDGKALRVVMTADGHGARAALHHADYGPDGTVAFEGSWNAGAEQVWSLRDAPEAPAPKLVCEREPFYDDNSPCVLPDGRVASLWMGRDGSKGHELKVVNADGTASEMLLVDVDIDDVGLGCSR
jgi:hypothetical protein